MDLSQFAPTSKEHILLLEIAKSLQQITTNTHAKPQETLEFKMNTTSKKFSFDQPLLLEDKWMMAVTGLEVYNTVYNITSINNTFVIETDYESELEEYENYLENLLRIIDDQINLKQPTDKFITKLKNERLNIELFSEDYDTIIKSLKTLKLSTEVINDLGFRRLDLDLLHPFNELKFIKLKIDDALKNNEEEYIKLVEDLEKTEFEESAVLLKRQLEYINLKEEDIHRLLKKKKKILITIPPGIYELKELSNYLQDKMKENPLLKMTIEAHPTSMHSILKTSHKITFNSELNLLLGFDSKVYEAGVHISEKPINIQPVDKVHLCCDCIEGSIVNGIREQILFSFNLSKPPGYKIFCSPSTLLFKKLTTSRLDHIHFYLQDTNHRRVDFNGESLTFTIQLRKI